MKNNNVIEKMKGTVCRFRSVLVGKHLLRDDMRKLLAYGYFSDDRNTFVCLFNSNGEPIPLNAIMSFQSFGYLDKMGKKSWEDNYTLGQSYGDWVAEVYHKYIGEYSKVELKEVVSWYTHIVIHKEHFKDTHMFLLSLSDEDNNTKKKDISDVKNYVIETIYHQITGKQWEELSVIEKAKLYPRYEEWALSHLASVYLSDKEIDEMMNQLLAEQLYGESNQNANVFYDLPEECKREYYKDYFVPVLRKWYESTGKNLEYTFPEFEKKENLDIYQKLEAIILEFEKELEMCNEYDTEEMNAMGYVYDEVLTKLTEILDEREEEAMSKEAMEYMGTETEKGGEEMGECANKARGLIAKAIKHVYHMETGESWQELDEEDREDMYDEYETKALVHLASMHLSYPSMEDMVAQEYAMTEDDVDEWGEDNSWHALSDDQKAEFYNENIASVLREWLEGEGKHLNFDI